jgi:cathepsin A (carboxypeptidase C)
MDALWYGHKYGLVDDDVYNTLVSAKCKNVRLPNGFLRRNLHRRRQFGNTNNNDDLQKNVDHSLQNDPILQAVHAAIVDNDNENNDKDAECTLAFRKFLISTSRGLSQEWDNGYIDDYSLFAPVSNDEDNAMTQYMNRLDVRAALHVDVVTPATTTTTTNHHHANNKNIPPPAQRRVQRRGMWPYPAGHFDYTKEYDACNWDDEISDPRSMIDFYRIIAPQLKVTWVYNGDTDPCVSYEGT